MKRYYLCDVIGDGQDAEPTATTGPFRPAVADKGVLWAGVIPTGPDGRPLKPWCLVIVDAPNHAPVLADQRVDRLPDFPLDGKVSAVNAATKTAMLNAMTKRGIDTSFVTGADGYRDVIRGIGRSLDAAFDENALDVS
ncbi:MAG: hypothetical protein H0W48_00375 [Methylibium sp.]|nr:hypothetical protein [Methylibium sp.]